MLGKRRHKVAAVLLVLVLAGAAAFVFFAQDGTVEAQGGPVPPGVPAPERPSVDPEQAPEGRQVASPIDRGGKGGPRDDRRHAGDGADDGEADDDEEGDEGDDERKQKATKDQGRGGSKRGAPEHADPGRDDGLAGSLIRQILD